MAADPQSQSQADGAALPAARLPASLDMPGFNTVDFINHIFPNEGSLAAVDPLIQKLRNRIRRVDAEILMAIRQQSTSGSQAKDDLAASMRAIEELSLKMRAIKAKAEQSEVMVQEICRDIKKLDYAKKHITATITALNRLAMLVFAVDRLQALTANRQYRDAADQLQAVTQLLAHFEAYSDIPKIGELQGRVASLKATLKSHIFSDFSTLGTPVLKENGQVMQQLADACLVVAALDGEGAARDELIRTVCSRELTAYQQIFQGTDVARLDKVERRYLWVKRQLKLNDDVWRIFPPAWHVQRLLCTQFCNITRAQLKEQLDGSKDRPDVTTLLQALERTLEFEDDLAKRFAAPQPAARAGAGGAASPTAAGSGGAAGGKEGEFEFHGAISACFEPHLGVYVDLEERTLADTLDKLMQEETWEAEEGSQTNILRSSSEMFLAIRKSFNRCCQLTRKQTLLSLFQVFKRVLRQYANRLSARLPRAAQPTAGGEWQVKMAEKDERVVCYIINTAEYCHETAAQLAESVANRIDGDLVGSVDIGDEQEEFSGVITRALAVLVVGLEARLDGELDRMARMPWSTLESVGDQSEFVNNLSAIFSNSIPMLAGLLSPLHFHFFLDKLAASFGPRYYATVFKAKRLSGTGAQQMLLDTHGIKTILLELPALGGLASTAAYSKYVTRELGRSEALLKVILSPQENIVDTYRALLPEGCAADFLRTLDLKGVKKPEQQPLLDALTTKLKAAAPTHGPTSKSPTSSTPSSSAPPSSAIQPATPAAAAAAAPPAATATAAAAAAAGMLTSAASREAMIARAAALGRGAMAQSAAAAAAVSQNTALKRIFALADSSAASGSKKDMSFRSLFNA
ncbi:hypothetical protein CLOM_g23913 [Closterium sp. NIES-68]|nr:hypothetical protein CLOM_g23913 [Closterium sp. NIES-68]GJP58734.1 hypothetical protein CLOP_g3319 [Closterium sp. NIES-67]